ncbi:hypothetical protein SAMN00777080_1980 [Aquiflexum balticum DSM 16537]|uniref:Uncharacterized protein n=1 Tax=Aquiflexum balticum DSM 16537 TaxID=758820 RepID=A0A1W2H442_9BACT|nr:hypothetical protein SAMN00777080_1980 [Aquiflexum balticum DSM 16537]
MNTYEIKTPTFRYRKDFDIDDSLVFKLKLLV